MSEGKANSSLSLIVAAVGVAFCASSLGGLPGSVNGKNADDAARRLIAKYAGSWEIGAFLDEPVVRRELESLLGPALRTLRTNLSVSGSVEFYGGALSVRGNAPHKGTLEEAVVCVQPFGVTPAVDAGVYSRGQVTVYTRQERYDFMTTCVKDWITLVNSGHADRLRQPGNVRMVVPH